MIMCLRDRFTNLSFRAVRIPLARARVEKHHRLMFCADLTDLLHTRSTYIFLRVRGTPN